MRRRAVLNERMLATHRRLGRSWAVAVALVLACVTPATARKQKAPAPKAAPAAASACDHPCAHVEDCPKVTCECSAATASGVAACDATDTHCCTDPATACRSFCESHEQKWTGRFTSDAAPAPTPEPGPRDATAPGQCDEPCRKAEDCRPITCQCAKGTAENVSACNANTNCCGSVKVVCDHYCTGANGKWTGKVAEAASEPAPQAAPEPQRLDDRFQDLYDDDTE
jgi:hypothetical protein